MIITKNSPSPFRHLFTPLRVGGVELRNRIIVPPHGVSFLPGYGSAIDRVSDYHVERARGGAALIVMSNFVTPPSWLRLGEWNGHLQRTPFGSLDMASDPDLRPAYAQLAKRIHAEGAVFVSQLNATGRQYFSPGMMAFNLPLVAPSAIPCPRTRQIPREMATADIEELIETFADSARNLQQAGVDGVELFAAQGYLLSEFLSPASNKRTDRYGGNAENRLRIVVESLEAIRSRTGPDFVIGIRINGDDFVPSGFTFAMAQDAVQALSARRLVDYVSVSGMTYLHYPGWIADMTEPEATFADLAGGLRAVADDIPVAVSTRIDTAELAERILASGQADMVGMVRALISDPELPRKAMQGRTEDVRRCTYSNQSCSMGQTMGRGVGCLHNPAVGREAQLGIGTAKPAPVARRVLVVGGGLAGLAAARVAAERGHAVTLVERDSELGGQNRMTASMRGRAGFAEVTRWQIHTARQLKVDIRPNTQFNADDVTAFGADAVILATGSTPCRTGYSSLRPEVERMPGAELGHVMSVFDVFAQPGRVGARVLILDEDPHLSAPFVAEHLAHTGRSVEIVTAHIHVCPGMHIAFVPDLNRRLHKAGVTITTERLVIGISPDHVTSISRHGGHERRHAKPDTVVIAMGNVANDALHRQLAGRIRDLRLIGDAVAPRLIEHAIADGERAGRSV